MTGIWEFLSPGMLAGGNAYGMPGGMSVSPLRQGYAGQAPMMGAPAARPMAAGATADAGGLPPLFAGNLPSVQDIYGPLPSFGPPAPSYQPSYAGETPFAGLAPLPQPQASPPSSGGGMLGYETSGQGGGPEPGLGGLGIVDYRDADYAGLPSPFGFGLPEVFGMMTGIPTGTIGAALAAALGPFGVVGGPHAPQVGTDLFQQITQLGQLASQQSQAPRGDVSDVAAVARGIAGEGPGFEQGLAAVGRRGFDQAVSRAQEIANAPASFERDLVDMLSREAMVGGPLSSRAAREALGMLGGGAGVGGEGGGYGPGAASPSGGRGGPGTAGGPGVAGSDVGGSVGGTMGW